MPPKYHTRPTWGLPDRRLSKEALVLQDYLGRCPTRTSEGIFPLALGYIEVDTPLSRDEVNAAFTELPNYDYDAANEVVLDRMALKNSPLRNRRDEDGQVMKNDKGRPMIDRRIPHAVRIFESLPDSPLKVEFLALADLHSPDLSDAIRAESKSDWRDLSKPLPSPKEAPSMARVEKSLSSEGERLSSGEREPERLSIVSSNGSIPLPKDTQQAQEDW